MRSRRDNNHSEIKAAFEQAGCSVADLSQAGGGVPDLLVSLANKNHLVEVKIPKGGILNSQRVFARRWNAPVYICRSVDNVVTLVEFWTGVLYSEVDVVE